MTTTRAFLNGLLIPPAAPVVNDAVYIMSTAPFQTGYSSIVNEAPTDGQIYSRQSSKWVVGAGLGEAPINTYAYFRTNGGWTSGGTLSTSLILSGDPTVALGAATKQYVDNSFSNLDCGTY